MTIYKKTKIIIISTLIISTVLLISPLTVQAATSIGTQISGGVEKAGEKIFGEKPNENATFSESLLVILNHILEFLGVIFFLFLIYGGYLWMNARGKEEQVEKAKKITREVVIGIIIIILARLLTELILTYIGGGIEAANPPPPPPET